MDKKPGSKILVTVLAYNEGDKLREVIERFPARFKEDLLIVDDGSTDNAVNTLKQAGYRVIAHRENLGVGAGIKSAFGYARRYDYDIIVIMAGNGKMLPEEIPRLVEPILSDKADYVQGSRFLEGGNSLNLPYSRYMGIKTLTWYANHILGFTGTDITCGFRAYRLSILDEPSIDIEQRWLDKYEMEYYLHFKVVKAGYRVVEVPVSMVYPESGKDYSKIRPVIGWWSMFRPWLFLQLGLKK